jgi:hypothetical protein
MLRSALVLIHASTGVAGLITGLGALTPPRPLDNRRWLRRLYAVSITILVTSMVALVAVDWTDLDVVGRVAFGALIGLGAVMVYRLARAYREASTQNGGWQERYIDHVHFTYISLWVGFVVLPALNLPVPQVSVPLVAVGVLLTGHALLTRYRKRLLADVGPHQAPDNSSRHGSG